MNLRTENSHGLVRIPGSFLGHPSPVLVPSLDVPSEFLCSRRYTVVCSVQEDFVAVLFSEVSVSWK